MSSAKIKREFYGWAVLDKYGVPVETIASIRHLGEELDIRTTLPDSESIVKMWDMHNNDAPHTIEKLYIEIALPYVSPLETATKLVADLRILLRKYRAEFTDDCAEIRVSGRGFDIISDTCEEDGGYEPTLYNLSSYSTGNEGKAFLAELHALLKPYDANIINTFETFVIKADNVVIFVEETDDEDDDIFLNENSVFKYLDKNTGVISYI